MAFYSPPTGKAPVPPPSDSVSKAEHLLEEVTARLQDLEAEKSAIAKIKTDLVEKLTKVSGLTKEEAKKELFDQLQTFYAADLAKLIEQTRADYQTRADEIARDIVISSMLHGATNYSAEYTVSTVLLPNDSVKGSIIGKEGRNIAAFEKSHRGGN